MKLKNHKASIPIKEQLLFKKGGGINRGSICFNSYKGTIVILSVQFIRD